MTMPHYAAVGSFALTLLKVTRTLPVLAAALLIALGTTQAQVSADKLAKPPAGAQVFTILSTSGTNGKGYIWTAEDGSQMSRDSVLLRGQVWEMDQRAVIGGDGMPSMLEVRGVTPQGDAAETFKVGRATKQAGRVRWMPEERPTLLRPSM